MLKSRFLVRPLPMEGESLSSWRQRAAVKNGFSSYPQYLESEPRSDPDVCSLQTAEMLSGLLQVSATHIAGLTVARYSSHLEDRPMRGRGRWLVPLRNYNAKLTHGPSFCVECLKTAAEPYFKTLWRLGFVTACPMHHQLLVDSCPNCQSLVWPSSIARYRLPDQKDTELHECSVCRFDLRLSPTFAADGAISGALEAKAAGAATSLSVRHTVPTAEYFAALARLSMLFLRKQTANLIAGSGYRFAEAVLSPDQLRQRGFRVGNVEDLPVSLRRPVIQASAELLQDWPKNFLSFASAIGLSQQYFPETDQLPAWMRAEIDAALTRRIRSLRIENVHKAIADLQNQGKPVNKQAVRAHLGGYTKSINELLGKRFAATEKELETLVQSLSVQTRPHSPQRRSVVAFLRSRALIGVSIVCRLPLDTAVCAPVTQLIWRCRTVTGLTPQGESLRLLTLQWIDEAMSLAKEAWGARLEGPFGGFKASNPLKCTRRLLREAMKDSIYSRLYCRPEVFFDAAAPLIKDEGTARQPPKTARAGTAGRAEGVPPLSATR